jgi:AraC-like DNA-binding protein/quercetin dioxygenase-like cupin family protein
MDSPDNSWYFSAVITETFSYLPRIEYGSLGSVNLVGAVKGKRGVINRVRNSFHRYALVLIERGQGVFSSESHGATEVTAGDLIILFPGVPHAYGPGDSETWDELYIVFGGELFDALLRGGLLDPGQPIVRGLDEWATARLNGLISLATRFSPEGTEPIETPPAVFLMRCASFVAEAVCARSPRLYEGDDSEWLREAYDALDCERPMDFSLEEIAARLGTSYGSFVKRFTRRAGDSPGRTRAQIVVQRACRMLRTGNLTVTEIAERLGFSDASYFCRRFRRTVGMSPTEFRRLSGGGA